MHCWCIPNLSTFLSGCGQCVSVKCLCVVQQLLLPLLFVLAFIVNFASPSAYNSLNFIFYQMSATRKKGKTIRSDEREVIRNVIMYCEKRKRKNLFLF